MIYGCRMRPTRAKFEFHWLILGTLLWGVLGIGAGSTTAAAQGVESDGPSPAVVHATSCLAGNGRVDTNLVNIGNHSSVYRLEFEGLTAREVTIGEKDWGRIPVTGRADGDYDVVVKRDGNVISSTVVTVACDVDEPSVDDDEIRIVNSCRDGFGYLLFQFVNSSGAPKPYIIEFEGVPNRSTTAAAYGATVRAVTGRPSGTYGVTVRSGVDPVETFDVTVDCEPPPEPVQLRTGSFIDLSHPTSGSIEVVELSSGQRVLRFGDDFLSDPGPDLDIYLSAGTDEMGGGDGFAADFVNLGDMISTSGAQEYVLPDGLDLDQYRTVSVWCIAFDVAFGAADLS